MEKKILLRCVNPVVITVAKEQLTLASKDKIYECVVFRGDYGVRVRLGYILHLTDRTLSKYFKML